MESFGRESTARLVLVCAAEAAKPVGICAEVYFTTAAEYVELLSAASLAFTL